MQNTDQEREREALPLHSNAATLGHTYIPQFKGNSTYSTCDPDHVVGLLTSISLIGYAFMWNLLKYYSGSMMAAPVHVFMYVSM